VWLIVLRSEDSKEPSSIAKSPIFLLFLLSIYLFKDFSVHENFIEFTLKSSGDPLLFDYFLKFIRETTEKTCFFEVLEGEEVFRMYCLTD
jgi:hypothetical protein